MLFISVFPLIAFITYMKVLTMRGAAVALAVCLVFSVMLPSIGQKPINAYEAYRRNKAVNAVMRCLGWLLLAAAISHSLDPYKFLTALFVSPFIMFFYALTGAGDWIQDVRKISRGEQ